MPSQRGQYTASPPPPFLGLQGFHAGGARGSQGRHHRATSSRRPQVPCFRGSTTGCNPTAWAPLPASGQSAGEARLGVRPASRGSPEVRSEAGAIALLRPCARSSGGCLLAAFTDRARRIWSDGIRRELPSLAKQARTPTDDDETWQGGWGGGDGSWKPEALVGVCPRLRVAVEQAITGG